ncbi:MAG: thioredoxin [Acidimicrobiia bacterium]|nr:thioredoxin [Acidimicrobiia bacterium]
MTVVGSRTRSDRQGRGPGGRTVARETVVAPSSRTLLLAAGVLVALALTWANGTAGASADEVTPAEPAGDPVVIDIYWGDGCPYCHDAIDDLTAFAEREAGIEVRTFEVWYDADNRATMVRVAEELGVRADAVPFIVVGTHSWSGYSGGIEGAIESTVLDLRDDRSPGEIPALEGSGSAVVDVPFLGDVDLDERSTLLATVLIALVDGFNPCSLWVLTVLLALVLHTGSRRRVLAIGGTFLAVTTLIYGLFIVGVYSTLGLASAMDGLRLVVAAFALTFGLVNVKDFFWFKRGVSFTISDERKPGIYRRARSLIRPGVTLPAALVGTVVMAGGIALIELPCTAGFPVIWSGLMRSAGLSTAEFGSLLGVYLAIYLLDELVIFVAAVLTMRVTKLQDRHGRALKLIGGMVMIAVAVAIVVFPDAMETISGVLAVFGVALLASLALLAIERAVRRPDPT